MAVRPKRDTPLLSDPYGLWCGRCGRRIKQNADDAEEKCDYHHVDQQWLGRGLKPILVPDRVYSPITSYNWDQFLVPVHKRCHSALDTYSARVASAVSGAYSVADPLRVDRVASRCFEDGDYAIAVRLRQCLRYRSVISENDEEQQRQHFQFELVAAAGLWFFVCRNLNEFLKGLPEELGPDLKERGKYSLFLLNPLVTFGTDGAVDLVRHFMASLPPRAGKALIAKAIRLDGIASLDHDITRRAEQMSEVHAGSHQQVTSIISNVWALLNERRDSQALDELNKIDDVVDASSWWQYFQIHFARGCSAYLAIGGSDLSAVITALLRAQLAMVVKGFRGWSIPDIRKTQRQRARALYPGHIIEFLVEKHGISEQRMDELRAEALSSRLLDKIWTPPDFEWPAESNVVKKP